MDDFRDMARDPKLRRGFERLLLLAAKRGDADLVAERLSWGIDPNCTTRGGRTPLILNARSYCPNVATVQALLAAKADPNHLDRDGLTALDYARRKLARLLAKPRRPQPRSPSLDENNQLRLSSAEQADMDEARARLGPEAARQFLSTYWKERLRAARRTFNDVDQVERIVEILEGVASQD